MRWSHIWTPGDYLLQGQVKFHHFGEIWHNRDCVKIGHFSKWVLKTSCTYPQNHFGHINSSLSLNLTQPRLCHFGVFGKRGVTNLLHRPQGSLFTHPKFKSSSADTTAIMSFLTNLHIWVFKTPSWGLRSLFDSSHCQFHAYWHNRGCVIMCHMGMKSYQEWSLTSQGLPRAILLQLEIQNLVNKWFS